MTAYLDTVRTAVPQQRKPRRQTARVIVKHTTEQPADLAGGDWNAENLAKYLAGASRQASYHRVDDRDSSIRLVEDANEAFGARGGVNQWALHSSFAVRTVDWKAMTDDQRLAYLTRAAQADADWCRIHGIPVRLITAKQAHAGDTGFVGHGHLQDDRTDPGWGPAEWKVYLDLVRSAIRSTDPIGFVEVPGRHWPQVGPPPLWDIYPDGRILPFDGAPDTAQLTDFGVTELDHPVTDAWYDPDNNSVVLYSAADRGRFPMPVRSAV